MRATGKGRVAITFALLTWCAMFAYVLVMIWSV